MRRVQRRAALRLRSAAAVRAAHAGGDVLAHRRGGDAQAAAPAPSSPPLRRRRAPPRRAGGERGGAPPAVDGGVVSGCLHGVSWDADGQELAAAGDAGELLVLDASGATRAMLQAREAALLGVCWARPKEVFTVGSRLLQRDARTRAPPVALAAEPNKGPHEAPQPQCVASHPQKPQIVAAGSSEGAVYVDVRAAAAPLAICARPRLRRTAAARGRRTAASFVLLRRRVVVSPGRRRRRRCAAGADRPVAPPRQRDRPPAPRLARRRLRRRGAHQTSSADSARTKAEVLLLNREHELYQYDQRPAALEQAPRPKIRHAP